MKIDKKTTCLVISLLLNLLGSLGVIPPVPAQTMQVLTDWMR